MDVTEIPPEIWVRVFEYYDFEDLIFASWTCLYFREIVKEVVNRKSPKLFGGSNQRYYFGYPDTPQYRNICYVTSWLGVDVYVEYFVERFRLYRKKCRRHRDTFVLCTDNQENVLCPECAGFKDIFKDLKYWDKTLYLHKTPQRPWLIQLDTSRGVKEYSDLLFV